MCWLSPVDDPLLYSLLTFIYIYIFLQVLGLQGKFKEAMVELRRALELEPDARPIHLELAKVREKARLEAESEKGLYRKMLGIKKHFTQDDRKYPVLKSVSRSRAWFYVYF